MNDTIKKMLLKLFQLSVLLVLLLPPAQAQTFKAGLIAGANFTQIDGDDNSGYRKIGLNTGIFAELPWSERWSTTIEILYAQRGSASAFNASRYADDFKLVLDYVEIPFIVKYHDVNRMNFGAGLSAARLLRTKQFNGGIESDIYFTQNPPNKWDFSALAEIQYPLSTRFLVNLRMAYSIVSFQKNIFSNNQQRIVGQYHKTIPLRFLYKLSGITEKRP